MRQIHGTFWCFSKSHLGPSKRHSCDPFFLKYFWLLQISDLSLITDSMEFCRKVDFLLCTTCHSSKELLNKIHSEISFVPSVVFEFVSGGTTIWGCACCCWVWLLIHKSYCYKWTVYFYIYHCFSFVCNNEFLETVPRISQANDVMGLLFF